MGHYIGTPCMPVYSLYSDKTKNGLISKEVVTRFLRMFPKIFLKNTENGNSAGWVLILTSLFFGLFLTPKPQL